MASAAGSLHTAIGLQGRHNPAARRAAELVASGKIGRPITATVVSPTIGFGPEMPVAHDLFNKCSSGANLLTITGGHTLDLVEAILGAITQVDACAEIRWPIVKLTETGEQSARDTADYVEVVGKTRSGAVFAAKFEGGVRPETVRFNFEVTGSNGWLRLTSDHPYGFQAGDLTLRSNIAFDEPDAPAASGAFIGAAINVGEVYTHLVHDLQTGTYNTLGFEHALHNARLMEAVNRAAVLDQRQKLQC
jgi:predicted dehydrogenase